MAMPTRVELNELIAARLAEDPTFRAQLLADPKAVLSEIAGAPVPDFVNVVVHEESATNVHLVLPRDESSLSEEDLAAVAGGVSWTHLYIP